MLIFDAIESGSTEELKEIIALGFDVNQRDPESNFTPLFLAVFRRKLDMCEILLSNKADPNIPFSSEGVTPLWYACWRGYNDICKLLIDNRARINHYVFFKVKDPFLDTFYFDFRKERWFDMIISGTTSLGKNYHLSSSPLTISCEMGNFDLCKMLVSLGVCTYQYVIQDYHRTKMTPLAIVFQKNRKLWRFLLRECVIEQELKHLPKTYFTLNEALHKEDWRRRILPLLLLERSSNEKSVFSEFNLPFDLFKEILKESELLI